MCKEVLTVYLVFVLFFIVGVFLYVGWWLVGFFVFSDRQCVCVGICIFYMCGGAWLEVVCIIL